MEYSVGSLADLITGQNTPNKPKVIQKEFKLRIKSDSEDVSNKSGKKRKTKKVSANEKLFENVAFEELPKLKKKKVKKEKLNKSSEGTPRKSPKHKLDRSTDLLDSDTEEPSPKKSKLSQNDENAERRVKKKIKTEKQSNPEYKEKTVFVGNIPINTKKIKIKKHFAKYGPIETLRIRGIPVADPKTPKKVAAIKKEFHPDRNTVFAYIRFVEKEDAEKAVAANGSIFMGNHIRVHLCDSTDMPDETKAIFVGNLSFDAEDEELWKLFEPCGAISHVRIIRDSSTSMGKGFGYVNFQDSDSVQLALEMENVMLKNRELRISLCNLNVARKNKNKNKQIKKSGKPKFRPRSRFGKNANNNEANNEGTVQKPMFKSAKFQGTKFNEKKKKPKVNKEKKHLIEKLTKPTKKHIKAD